MNNYERIWFNKWFKNTQRLLDFRKKIFVSNVFYEPWGNNGAVLILPYNYPPNSPAVKDTQYIKITKHKIDQCIKERLNEYSKV